MTSATDHPLRPAVLALRVGITGVRKLSAASRTHVTFQLEEILSLISATVGALGGKPQAREIYGVAPPTPTLRFLSPLARGADRLGARVALDRGFLLHVVTPFPVAEYRNDFGGREDHTEPPLSAEEDLAEFDELLARADGVAELDGARGMDINRSYEAAGRFVARNCDLMIAIWDGGPGAGRGGTAEIVRYAAAVGLPICWINAARDVPARWIESGEDLRQPAAAAAALPALPDHLARLVRPPRSRRGQENALMLDRVGAQAELWIRRASTGARRSLARKPSWATYFGESHLKDARVWRVFGLLIDALAGQRKPSAPALAEPWPAAGPDPSSWWRAQYAPPDELATAYADRYRSTYVLVFGLAAAAVTLGALILWLGGFEARPEAWIAGFALVEAAALIGIAALVEESRRRDWHRRSVEYRLLAELCRAQQTLAPFGWSVPTGAAESAVGLSGGVDPGAAGDDHAAWVAWLFAALQRAAPLPAGSLGAGLAERQRELTDGLLDGQLRYHAGREDRMRRAGERLAFLGEAFFFGVGAAVLLKLALLAANAHPYAQAAGLLALILPGLSAALFGVRAHAEMELLAARSRRMLRSLAATKRRISRLDAAAPLASQALGAESSRAVAEMLQDLEGWAQISGVKAVEAG